ncbi:hypothetical protein BSKO_12265 [Bryopsis sp. KO-2023]|nr:hypothetical protein BSKO_12265 [Bryopsis sp. KO-2023]
MVLAPLTTPAHFTGRRTGPPVKGQAAPPSPTAAASPRSRLRAWRGKSFSEDSTPSPGAVHRSIFSLDPNELAAMFLEAPDQKQKEENKAGPRRQEEPVLPNFEKPWDEVWAEGSPKAEEDRYVVVDHPGLGGQASTAEKAQELMEDGDRRRRRLAAVGSAVGGSILLLLFCTVKPRTAVFT